MLREIDKQWLHNKYFELVKYIIIIRFIHFKIIFYELEIKIYSKVIILEITLKKYPIRYKIPLLYYKLAYVCH